MRHSDESDPVRALRETVARSLAQHVRPGEPVAVALSGGRDSVTLLDALAVVAPPLGHALTAVHVHHGLSPHADAWQRHCVEVCAAHGVPLTVRAVTVSRAPQTSLEAEARRLRYAALAGAAAASGLRVIALAHHRDDQAETLLLQLLRGAGPHGLAAMPATHTDATGTTFVRPLLDVARTTIDAYARTAHLAWVDDESNAQHRHRRNAVRDIVMPALERVFPAPATTLARAAAHQADAAQLADDLAAVDARTLVDGAQLDRAGLAALTPARARNLLRWFLRQQGLPAPSSARLRDMLLQLAGATGDTNPRIAHAGVELGVFHGRIVLHPPAAPRFEVEWHGERDLALPHGRLTFEPIIGAGLDAARLGSAPVHVRHRAGGERLQLAPNRPRRALSALLYDARIPPWERAALPLVFCGDRLAAVPGLGIDVAYQASPGAPGYRLDWQRTRGPTKGQGDD